MKRSWQPATPSAPDGGYEARYSSLIEVNPTLARTLCDRFALRWLREAGLDASHLEEVEDTLELLVAEDWEDDDGSYVLRLRSWYTGTTDWLREWSGDEARALAWIDDIATMCARWVHDERRISGVPSRWDVPTDG